MHTCLRNIILRCRVSVTVKKMSSFSFIQHLNPISNKMEWKVVHDDYDYNREIATSCYGDMLHDDERNKKFGEALKKAIKKLHMSGRKAHVLDIGTGTGLLSMLAIRHGADSVVACEAFLPVANCAINILQENNFSDKIKIVKCHSTSLTVGENGDLKQKANILVSEVFDTELIGEGAIKTFNHAFEHLLEEDCIVIPSSGTVYAQVVESDLAQKWNKLKDWKSEVELLIKIPEKIKKCPGAAAIHDIQLSEFDSKHFKILSEVLPIFRFDWAKNKKIPVFRQKMCTVRAISSGKAQVLFVWWDLNMDEDGEILLSCAPVWEHPNIKGKNLGNDLKQLAKTLPWRDHWMQAVYFLTQEHEVKAGEEFTLVSNHDEFSFWFEIETTPEPRRISETSRPICECAFHFILSRTRIGAMNDERRRKAYLKALKKMVDNETICVVLGDLSLLGILCARLGAKRVYVLSESPAVEKVCTAIFEENHLTNGVVVGHVRDVANSLNTESDCSILIVSEPYFRNYILPWDNIAVWYMKQEIIEGVKKQHAIRTVPNMCRLKCCALQFDNLWKIATPLDTCEGFSMKMFDDLIATAKDKAENYTEAQPLWEYPGIALTKMATVFEFDFSKELPKEKVQRRGRLGVEWRGRCDGVALWMEYQLGEDCVVGFGPVEEVVPGEYVAWDMYERQGVHLFRKGTEVGTEKEIRYEAGFDPREAEFTFEFSLGSKEVES